MQNPNLVSNEEVEIFIELFLEEKSFMTLDMRKLTFFEIKKWLSEKWVRTRKISFQIDLFADLLLSQNLCEVQE